MKKPAILCALEVFNDKGNEALRMKLIEFQQQGTELYLTSDETAETISEKYSTSAQNIISRTTFNIFKNNRDYCFKVEGRLGRHAHELIFVDRDPKTLKHVSNVHGHTLLVQGQSGEELAAQIDTIHKKINPT